MEDVTHRLDQQLAAARAFISAAFKDGVITLETKQELEAFATARHAAVFASTLSATAPVRPEPPVRAPQTTESGSPEAAPAPPIRRPAEPAAPSRPPPTRPPSPRPPAPVQPVPPQPRGPTMGERIRERAGVVWSRLSADFAANALIYLGVLLSVVVIFTFFAFGYFGEAVETPSMRSLIFVAAPAIFFGLAWILRNKTGVPAAANAVGLIGALILPIMVSAVFRDGADWSNREGLGGWFPLSWIPDLSGPDRWPGYAFAGILCAAIYFVLATRHRIYAYGVAPMLWAVVGSLGLFWTMDMSGPQMLTVLAAIGVGLLAATLGQATFIGRTIAVETVRIGVIGAPVVFVIALLFAYNDAIESGSSSPGLSDLANPGALAAGILAAILAISSTTGFAWSALGERTRASLAITLRVAAYLAAGAALVLSLSYEASPGWVGAALVGYGLAVAAIDRLVVRTGDAAIWIARTSIVVGAAVSLVDPIATTVVWSFVVIVATARAVVPTARPFTNPLLPYPDSDRLAQAELWLSIFFLVGAGVARIVDLENVPVVLLTAAIITTASQLLPNSLERLKSLSTIPTVAFAGATVLAAAEIQAALDPYELREVGLGLIVVAVIAATVAYPWTWRLPFVLASVNAAAITIAADAVDTDIQTLSLIAALSLAITGSALVVGGITRALTRWCVPHAAWGHIAIYVAIVASMWNERAFFAALSIALVVHGVEAILAYRHQVPAIEKILEGARSDHWLRDAPAIATFVGILPWTIAASLQFEWFAVETARLGITLGAVAVLYAVAAILTRPARVVNTAAALACVSSAAAVVAAVPDGVAMITALSAGSVAIFLVCITWRVPMASTISWALAFIAVVIAANEAGVVADHLHRPLVASAIGVTAASALGVIAVGRRSWMTPWITAATITGSVAMAVGMVGVVALADIQWPWALAAAGASLATVVAYRAGTVLGAMWVYLLIAYFDVFEIAVKSDAVWLVPLAGVMVGVAALLPDRTSWRPSDPSPVTVVAALVTMTMAIELGMVQGRPGATMAWSALLIAALTVVRSEDAWIHIAGALLIVAGIWTLGPWLTASLAVVAAAETLMTEAHRKESYGSIGPWVAVVLWGGTFVAGVSWLDLEPPAVTMLALSLGAVISVSSLASRMMDDGPEWIRRWWTPLLTLGQVGLVGSGLYAMVELASSDAAFVGSAIAWLEAMLVGVPATMRRSAPGVWASAALVGVGAALAIRGLQMEWIEAVWTTGSLAVILLTVWLIAVVGTESDRAALWELPAAGLAQITIASSGVLAIAGLTTADAYLAWFVLLAIDGLAIAAVATVTLTPWMSYVSASLTAAALNAAMGWKGLGRERPWVWLAAMILAGAGAWTATRFRGRPRPRLWMLPAHAFTVFSALAAGSLAIELLPSTEARLIGAILTASLGFLLLANRGWLAEHSVGAEPLAALSFSTSAAFIAASLSADSVWTPWVLLSFAAIGTASAGVAGYAKAPIRGFLLMAATGLTAVSALTTMAMYTPLSQQFGWMLIVNGATFAAFALTDRNLLTMHIAVATWLTATLILIDQRWTLELHATVLAVSVVLLVMLEVERVRRSRGEIAMPDGLRFAEWALLLVPLVLAAVDMVTESVSFGILLAAEGAALLVWGMLSRTRRRAILGLAAITAALLMAVLIPLVRGLTGDLTGGTWLLIGGIAAVIFIAVGSLLEKYRIRMGQRLRHFGEVMEGWN